MTCSCGMALPKHCVPDVGFGCLHHHGGPGPTVARLINALTKTDSTGRRYYRRFVNEGWRRLRGSDDFDVLNQAIDYQRNMARYCL